MKNDFLIWNKVEKDFCNANNELHNILEEIKKNENIIILKSLYIYGVSTFENIMTDTLRYYITSFPGKIKEKSITITKEELINERDFLIEKTIDKAVINLSYESLDKYLKSLTDIFDIIEIPENITSKLIEIKETRNLITHNNLRINTVYLSKCRPDCIRANVKQLNEKLPFDKKYACDSIELCKQILCENIYLPLKEKYSSHTKIKAMKEIWEYLFNSPILEFDEYWEYDANGKLLAFHLDQNTLRSRLRSGYSTSESILMSYILMHYYGSLSSLDDSINIDLFNPTYLYNERKIKFLYLQDIFFRYPELFQQD